MLSTKCGALRVTTRSGLLTTTQLYRSISSREIADAKPKAQSDSEGKVKLPESHDTQSTKEVVAEAEKPERTMAELDEDLRQKMSGMAGDGGAAGVEYEDGKPVAMKRGVRDNMFRYI